MYEESISFIDIAIVALVICGAACYLYRKLFAKSDSKCSSGCSSCPSAQKSYRRK